MFSIPVTLGGRLELKIAFPGTDFEVRTEGFYEVIEPPARLVHTWRSVVVGPSLTSPATVNAGSDAPTASAMAESSSTGYCSIASGSPVNSITPLGQRPEGH